MGAGSIILPNVTIGNKVIIGAGSVVSKAIPDGVVAVGNPIRIIGTYDAYMDKCRNLIATLEDKKELMRQEIEDCGFLV